MIYYKLTNSIVYLNCKNEEEIMNRILKRLTIFCILVVSVFMLSSCESGDDDNDDIERTITVSSSGNGSVDGAGNFNIGDSISVEATAATGYEFSNWTDANDSSVIISTDSRYSFDVSESINLVANFILVDTVAEFLFNRACDDHISFTEDSDVRGYYAEGETITLTVIIEEGYTFEGWWLNDTLVSTNLTYSFEIVEETVLRASIN